MNDIENKVLKCISPLSFIEPSLDESFANLGLDSLNTMELILQIEKKFKIKIPNKVFVQVKNGRDLVNYIQKVAN